MGHPVPSTFDWPDCNAMTVDHAVLSSTMFERLCSPATAERIVECHLDQRCAIISDDRLPGIDLDLSRLFEILRDRSWRSEGEIQFYAHDRGGPSSEVWTQAIGPGGSLTLDTILHLRAAKTSIYVKNLQRMHQGLRELAADLSKTGYFKATISAIYSPAGALSTPNHFDTSDVLAVQLHGQKSWTVDSRARTTNAMPNLSQARPDCFEFFSSTQHTTHVGEALFIPRGFLHNAMANEEESLHLVIGLLPLTWFDAISNLVQTLCDTDPAFRASVLDGTPGVGPSENSAPWRQRLADPDAIAEAAREVMRKRAKNHMLNDYGQLFAKSPNDMT